MANEANSRDTVPNFRWGETAGGASVSVNVVAPSSGKQDTGWIPGSDGIVGEWWNWLHWAARVAFRYVENFFGLDLVYNHVLTGAAGTEGVITDGAGLSINVSSARCWIGGAMYTVPAAVNLALAAADPSDPRLDLVYARATGSPAVPSYAVVTGTPDPSVPTPALPAGGCAIGTVRVNAAAVAPGTKLSLREFGGLQMDRLIARKRIDVGDIGGTPAVTIRDTAGIVVGDPANPTFWAIGGDFVMVDPTLFGFSGGASITRKCDLSPADFTGVHGGGFAVVGADSADNYNLTVFSAGTLELIAPVQVPNGATIKAFRAYGEKVGTGDVTVSLIARSKIGGSFSPTNIDTTGKPIGTFMVEQTGLSVLVDQSFVYFIRLVFSAVAQPVKVWAAEVEYTEINPFDSL
jgi:hypothetical protein